MRHHLLMQAILAATLAMAAQAPQTQITAPEVEIVPPPIEDIEIVREAAQIIDEQVPAVVPAYTAEEREILALIIYQEAGGDACSDSTRQMVGEVFLNRVASPLYPNTFYEVATQRAQYGRLHWTGLEWPERAEWPQEAHAVARAYSLAEDLLTESVDRLLPSDTIFQAEFEQGTETVAQENGFYFCR